jgi:hypothetical protein
VEFRATKRIGYNILKGWNAREYPGRHWSTNQKAKQHRSTKNKMERSTAFSRLSVHRTGPRCPTSFHVPDDDDDSVFFNTINTVVQLYSQGCSSRVIYTHITIKTVRFSNVGSI